VNNKIEVAANRLWEAENTKVACDPVRDLIGVTDLETAYAIQQINSQKRIQNGARVVGHKIGLTSRAVQTQLGVDQPDFGLLWNDREIENGGELSVKELMQPKAETEIAFVLSRDLPSTSSSSVDIIRAIDFAMISIEIVGSRIRNWDIKITDTIADNASASHWVIGHTPILLSNIDLVKCKMQMKKNGQMQSTGQGANCLGSPINAVRWLANKMATIGTPLKAGDLIMSGALGKMVEVNAGDKFEANIEGLGQVNVSFTD